MGRWRMETCSSLNWRNAWVASSKETGVVPLKLDALSMRIYLSGEVGQRVHNHQEQRAQDGGYRKEVAVVLPDDQPSQVEAGLADPVLAGRILDQG